MWDGGRERRRGARNTLSSVLRQLSGPPLGAHRTAARCLSGESECVCVCVCVWGGVEG